MLREEDETSTEDEQPSRAAGSLKKSQDLRFKRAVKVQNNATSIVIEWVFNEYHDIPMCFSVYVYLFLYQKTTWTARRAERWRCRSTPRRPPRARRRSKWSATGALETADTVTGWAKNWEKMKKIIGFIYGIVWGCWLLTWQNMCDFHTM